MDRGASGEEPISMAAIIQQMDAADRGTEEPGVRAPRRGEIVEGTVTSIDRDGILIDVGAKFEGTVVESEVLGLINGTAPPKAGDTVLAYVISPSDREGRVVLSLVQGMEERAWRQLEQMFNAGTVFDSIVTEANKGGLIVDALGLRGFVPMSQISSVRHDGTSEEEVIARLQSMLGKSLPLKVVEINRRRGRLILSERIATQEQRGRRKDDLIAELVEGEIRPGRVTSLTDFGAFVDIGGADGLVHLSELSWTRVARAADVVSVGDEVQVLILGVDRDKKKIALSLRRTKPEPWAQMAQKYQPGDIVEGTITKLAAFGAFAQIDDGIEGLIHISELSDSHVTNPRQVIQEGEHRRMRILRVEPERRRLGLSLRSVPAIQVPKSEPESETDPEPDYMDYSPRSGGTTIGEAAFGSWKPNEDER